MGNEQDDLKKTCADCQGEMVLGFVPDQAHMMAAQLTWVEGKPESHWVGGVKMPKGGTYRVTGWRCEDCGVLKLYAHKKDWLPVND